MCLKTEPHWEVSQFIFIVIPLIHIYWVFCVFPPWQQVRFKCWFKASWPRTSTEVFFLSICSFVNDLNPLEAMLNGRRNVFWIRITAMQHKCTKQMLLCKHTPDCSKGPISRGFFLIQSSIMWNLSLYYYRHNQRTQIYVSKLHDVKQCSTK